MAEDSYSLKLDVDPKLWKDLQDGGFDLSLESKLAEELKKPVKVKYQPVTQPGQGADKELVLIILAAGFTAGLVGNAVVKILQPWIHKRTGADGTPHTLEDETTYSAELPLVKFTITNKTKST
jgi:hypothetical protein